MRVVRILLVLVVVLFFGNSSAQNTDRYWVFGDSAGIDFSNLASPAPVHSILQSRGTCASICDSVGNLLFYCGSPLKTLWLSGLGNSKYGFVINKNHQLLQNGDTLIGSAWYQEMVIVPDPGDRQQYYIFCSGELEPTNGLYYSKVDLNYNNGLGKVIQKNIQLNTDSITDGITAVRHGNGRDWWVLVRNWKGVNQYTNDVMIYYVSPSGVQLHSIQQIGIQTSKDGFFRLKFNSDGSKLYNVSAYGIIERFDFDRCSGVLSNEITYEGLSGPPYKAYWGFEVSPNESKLYVTSIYQTANQDTGYLIQFDLNAANFAASADTLYSFLNDIPGILKKGPDNKIYLSTMSASPDTCFDYLYCYGNINNTNANLSVINRPDSAGTACDFQPFSFNLGGHKAYWGLPNNPYYELGAWVGSPCDTLTVGLPNLVTTMRELKLYYNSDIKTVFINAEKLSGRTARLQFYTSSGQLIEELSQPINGGYFTYSSSFAYQPDGVYVVRLVSEKEVLAGKFVKR
jgi:hypothetical protein